MTFSLLAVVFLLTGCVEEMKGRVIDEEGQAVREKPQLYTPTPDDLVEDTSTGLLIAKEIIYLTFRKSASRETVDEIITASKGVIVGHDRSANIYQVRYAGRDLATIDAIRKKLLTDHPEVEVASRLSVSVHEDPYYVR